MKYNIKPPICIKLDPVSTVNHLPFFNIRLYNILQILEFQLSKNYIFAREIKEFRTVSEHLKIEHVNKSQFEPYLLIGFGEHTIISPKESGNLVDIWDNPSAIGCSNTYFDSLDKEAFDAIMEFLKSNSLMPIINAIRKEIKENG